MLRALGCSVAGPAHADEGRPNEDAWLARVSARGGFAVVCDGLGSRPLALLGARAATRAASRAWRQWSTAPHAELADFVRLVEVLWRLELGPVALADACTTLLFAGLRADGSGLVAQLGDGLTLVSLSGGPARVLTPERQDFASCSLALGAPHTLADWTLSPLPAFPPRSLALLTTDGISDDLVPEHRGAFAARLRDEYGATPGAARRLRAALHDWPVPHHRDDKTLVLLWNPDDL